jgi:hypothetical protein
MGHLIHGRKAGVPRPRQEATMRTALLLIFLSTISLSTGIQAQSSRLELQAALGYAHVFDAGGISFAAALERSLSPAPSRVQHGLGGSLWYAHTGIASSPNDPEGRHLLGLGVRYQVLIRPSKSFRPFLAVPVQILHSQIPDRVMLLSARVPEPPPARPVEDVIGGAWGWGTGLELGFRLGSGKRLNAHTSVQAMYQDIYGSSSRHGAWIWHAGVTYALRGS